MISKPAASLTASLVTASATAILAACGSMGGSAPATVPVTPICTIMPVLIQSGQLAKFVTVYERTDPTVDPGFVRRGIFRSIPFTGDVWGISEAWLRKPLSLEVHRAFVLPAQRTLPDGTTDDKASAWAIQAQNATGAWSPVFGRGSANSGNEEDDPAAASMTVPQLMPVGLTNLEMFACAGGRSDDKAFRTTLLVKSVPPNPATGAAVLIQDLLNGDDRFVPNPHPGPLSGTNTKPNPPLSGPGNPIRTGSVKCAMTQVEDEVATRELHMLAIDHGVLYHSVASNWGPFDGGNAAGIRFRSITPWGDVGQALGSGFGNIVSAAIVASRPSAISVFFVAESGGRYRLWHAVRFSATGTWRPADDVFLLADGSAAGSPDAWQVAAGLCPAPGATEWTAQNTEVLAVLWGRQDIEMLVWRVVSKPQQWTPTRNGIYSPRRSLGYVTHISGILPANVTVPNIAVTTRPFRDDAVPPP